MGENMGENMEENEGLNHVIENLLGRLDLDREEEEEKKKEAKEEKEEKDGVKKEGFRKKTVISEADRPKLRTEGRKSRRTEESKEEVEDLFKDMNQLMAGGSISGGGGVGGVGGRKGVRKEGMKEGMKEGIKEGMKEEEGVEELEGGLEGGLEGEKVELEDIGEIFGGVEGGGSEIKRGDYEKVKSLSTGGVDMGEEEKIELSDLEEKMDLIEKEQDWGMGMEEDGMEEDEGGKESEEGVEGEVKDIIEGGVKDSEEGREERKEEGKEEEWQDLKDLENLNLEWEKEEEFEDNEGSDRDEEEGWKEEKEEEEDKEEKEMEGGIGEVVKEGVGGEIGSEVIGSEVIKEEVIEEEVIEEEDRGGEDREGEILKDGFLSEEGGIEGGKGLDLEDSIEVLKEDLLDSGVVGEDNEGGDGTKGEGKEIFTEQEMMEIQRNIEKLPIETSRQVKEIILGEGYPFENVYRLTQSLLIEGNEKKVEEILREEFGIIKDGFSGIGGRIEEESVFRKKKRKKVLISMIGVGVIILLGGWILWVGPYLEREKLYKAGILDIQKGARYYDTADKKFKKGGGGGLNFGHRGWIKSYAEEYIKRGDPEGLYRAHKLLMGDDEENRRWKEKYIKSKDVGVGDGVRGGPGQEEVKEVEGLGGGIEGIEGDRGVGLLIGELFTKKGIWANMRGEREDMNYYFDEALKKGYEPLLSRGMDEELLDKIAKLYIRWGNLLSKEDQKSMEEKYKMAEETYHKILTEDSKSSYGLYGLLNIHLVRENYSKADQLYNSIEQMEIDRFDQEVLSEYAIYLLKEKKSKEKAKIILDKIIKGSGDHPRSYYYLGLTYEGMNDLEKALESYIKGLFAFYKKKIGQEEFNKRLRQESQSYKTLGQIEILTKETKSMINEIRKDSNPENILLQSNIFNRIGVNFLDLASNLKKTIEHENIKKERLMISAKKSFLLSLEKNSSNPNPWKNLGDLAYLQATRGGKDFLDEVGVEIVERTKSLKELKKKEQFMKSKKYYMNALNLMINDGKDELINSSNLWEHLLKGIKEFKVKDKLFYKIGYLFFKDDEFENAIQMWESIKSHIKQKFNPILNFSLGNAYLKVGDNSSAQRHYENVIEFYKEMVFQYQNNLDSKNLKQNQVFTNLAKVHNNLGVTFHIMGEKENKVALRNYARYHYYKAREYASKLNNKIFLQEEQLNSRKLIENIIFIENQNIKLKNRKIKNDKKTTEILDPLDHMMIENIEPFLKQ